MSSLYPSGLYHDVSLTVSVKQNCWQNKYPGSGVYCFESLPHRKDRLREEKDLLNTWECGKFCRSHTIQGILFQWVPADHPLPSSCYCYARPKECYNPVHIPGSGEIHEFVCVSKYSKNPSDITPSTSSTPSSTEIVSVSTEQIETETSSADTTTGPPFFFFWILTFFDIF